MAEAGENLSETAEGAEMAQVATEQPVHSVETPVNMESQPVRNQSPLTPRQRWTPPTEPTAAPEINPLQGHVDSIALLHLQAVFQSVKYCQVRHTQIR